MGRSAKTAAGRGGTALQGHQRCQIGRLDGPWGRPQRLRNRRPGQGSHAARTGVPDVHAWTSVRGRLCSCWVREPMHVVMHATGHCNRQCPHVEG
eukprot:365042-Chlamydomonas_euryale.AAC.22